ncbi:hypothetical protein [Bradyrhizobium sp. Ai1a-2]|uniref:hypothetical protein n=1 Tax=Bradyrhizobium sp. Ai1a-2 TaxID=196490 RepID=UPI000480D8CE|nr:hypothetical protein [Bradyrhizobium sp. Ai1a-2]
MADNWINGLGGATSGAPPAAQAGGGPAAGTTADILRNQVLSQLVTVLTNAFPQASAQISDAATAGSGTVSLPAHPAAFLTINISGQAFKIPLYEI